jgi:DNA-binding CsgD family transcriptional regulator
VKFWILLRRSLHPLAGNDSAAEKRVTVMRVWDGDGLADLVYGALLGETTWQRFLDELAGTIPDGRAGLIMHDRVAGDGFALFDGADPATTLQYNSYYGRLNPLQQRLAGAAVGWSGHDDDLVPREDLVRTEFYHDFLVPHGLQHTSGVKFGKAGTQSFSLAIGSGCGSTAPLRRSVQKLKALLPLIKRAFRFHRREAHERADAADFACLLDLADVSLIVADDGKRVRRLSKAAEAMLAGRAPLRISADGRVRFRAAGVQAAFERMLKRGHDGPGIMEVRSFGTRMVLARASKDDASLYFEGPSVLILLEKFDAGSARFDLALAGEAYGLSRGEMRALSGILAGKSVGEIAAEASLSRETIRSQVKSLYAKTGAKREADILRLVREA